MGTGTWGQPEDEPLPSAVTFHAEDLLDRFGFQDGDMLEPFREVGELWKAGRGELLAAAVSHFLLPRLPAGIVLYEVKSQYNNVRVLDRTDPTLLRGVKVTVPLAELRAFLEDWFRRNGFANLKGSNANG